MLKGWFLSIVDVPKGWLCFIVGIIRHFFSETALVHTYIPHTYIPCGRVIGNWSYIALVGFPRSRVAVPRLFVTLLYHTFGDLSRGF